MSINLMRVSGILQYAPTRRKQWEVENYGAGRGDLNLISLDPDGRVGTQDASSKLAMKP